MAVLEQKPVPVFPSTTTSKPIVGILINYTADPFIRVWHSSISRWNLSRPWTHTLSLALVAPQARLYNLHCSCTLDESQTTRLRRKTWLSHQAKTRLCISYSNTSTTPWHMQGLKWKMFDVSLPWGSCLK